eukprot:gnl/TRDRNA2_/TRDRNA2_199322_c0_seq1.p1 gnl/TRDRNA2_/TRDRNA2_199322_c0~~gnl/TRDRNA2_/TRDRNA2_199322_c0_seq1.p1  ORF type:complete len:221 (-),score=36.98 gnl/TRDRNA2_/TRDRNA2_199322_c0_seq1:21-683(-)
MTKFTSQELAITAWAFATVKQSDEKLFLVLGLVAEARLSQDAKLLVAVPMAVTHSSEAFSMQELTKISWAFAEMGRLDVRLMGLFVGAAEQSAGGFGTTDAHMMLRALSGRKDLHIAWRLFDHAKCISSTLHPLCLGALLTECEQRDLFDHRIALLRGLEVAGIATTRLPAPHAMKLPEAYRCTDGRHLDEEVFLACAWCRCMLPQQHEVGSQSTGACGW